MKPNLWTLLFGLGLSVTMWAAAHDSHATLGEPFSSRTTERKALAASPGTTTTYTGYTVHEYGDDATTVREYTGPDGIVFGVAWEGQVNPDLNQLLGRYFQEYRAASENTPRKYGVRHRKIKTDGVVVQTWGHMRDLHGRAYAPDLIPPGVSTDDIQ